MDIIVDPKGIGRCIYGESLPLVEIGCVHIERASHVEPTSEGKWIADLAPVKGPCMGLFDTRSEALQAEVAWLHEHWLNPRAG